MLVFNRPVSKLGCRFLLETRTDQAWRRDVVIAPQLRRSRSQGLEAGLGGWRMPAVDLTDYGCNMGVLLG